PMPASVVIVGGGLMGLSAAWHLRRAEPGARVVVLERAQVGAAASGASAAGVRVMGRDPAERALALASLGRWPELDRELDGATGYRRGGGLRVALDDASWRAVPAWVAEQRGDGVPVDVVDAGDARRLAPEIAAGCPGGVLCAVDRPAEAAPTSSPAAGPRTFQTKQPTAGRSSTTACRAASPSRARSIRPWRASRSRAAGQGWKPSRRTIYRCWGRCPASTGY